MEEPAKHLNVSLPISLSQKSQLYRLGRMQFTRLGSSLTAKSKSFVLDTIHLLMAIHLATPKYVSTVYE